LQRPDRDGLRPCQVLTRAQNARRDDRDGDGAEQNEPHQRPLAREYELGTRKSLRRIFEQQLEHDSSLWRTFNTDLERRNKCPESRTGTRENGDGAQAPASELTCWPPNRLARP